MSQWANILVFIPFMSNSRFSLHSLFSQLLYVTTCIYLCNIYESGIFEYLGLAYVLEIWTSTHVYWSDWRRMVADGVLYCVSSVRYGMYIRSKRIWISSIASPIKVSVSLVVSFELAWSSTSVLAGAGPKFGSSFLRARVPDPARKIPYISNDCNPVISYEVQEV